MAKDRFINIRTADIKLKLISTRGTDPRRYNLPTTSEVVTLIVGDIDSMLDHRNIVLEKQGGGLQRINELHVSYLPLQYPLLFPFGEDGFKIDIPVSDVGVENRKRTRLRADLYKNLSEAANEGNIDPTSAGKRFVLPSSFTGGPRYMMQNYQDAMEIYLFITFTCNTKFLEERGLKPEDRLHIVCRVFKLKLNDMVKYIKKKKISAEMKRGLPHAHILIFLDEKAKTFNAADIDNIISAEIPDQVTSPALFRVVSERMVHGPCGAQNIKSRGRCTKHYPKEFVEITTVDDEGYPIYRRRNNGHAIKKNECDIDNHYVVPYNRELLLCFNAHINVEWCN
ncbi:hypothetical protein V2J09_010599 [Rumex salicifolius]